MVAQWVREKSKAIKGTDKAKRIGADLHTAKATKASIRQTADNIREYEEKTGRNAKEDFLEWMGQEWGLVIGQYSTWLDLRISELRNEYDWKKDI